MAFRSSSISDDKHPILKGLSSPIDDSDDGIIDWRENTSKTPLPLPSEMTGTRSDSVQALCCMVPRRFLNSTLTILTVLCNVGMNVTLPIYAGAMIKAGGDPFDVIFISSLYFPLIFFGVMIGNKYLNNRDQKLFPTGSFKMAVLVGFLTAVNGILVVFASPPERTPPYLQGILATTLVPFTVFFRYLVLRKGVSFHRLACTGVVIIGLFITVEPQIWSLQGSQEGSSTAQQSSLGRILWPFCFAMGFVPAALLNVYIEKETKSKEAESLVFISWIQLTQTTFVILSFWTDFIPAFGHAKTPKNFFEILKSALACNFSSSPTCYGVAYKSWMFVLSYFSANLSSFLLIQYAEGAVYAVVVQALVTPLATLFWTVFQPEPSFHWGPEFTTTTAFTLAGLFIITPAVVMYNYFSNREAAAKKEGNIQTP